MKAAVIVFPGSNADWDAFHVVRDVMKLPSRTIFHKETNLGDADLVILPGGFSYGDYLRAGAMAAHSPIAPAIKNFAERGGRVLGICNGFQILTEMHLLPGMLTKNVELRFECHDVHLRVENHGAFTYGMKLGVVLRMPIAHAEGRFQCDEATLRTLHENNQVAFRYCDAAGNTKDGQSTNVNGSLDHIAGIYNQRKNVLGLMPHPERASEGILGNSDGLALFQAAVKSFEADA